MNADTGSNGPTTAAERILLTKERKWWVATDEQSGVTSQGKTRTSALENLDEAIAGDDGEGRPPTREELDSLGIDPESNESSGSLPDGFE